MAQDLEELWYADACRRVSKQSHMDTSFLDQQAMAQLRTLRIRAWPIYSRHKLSCTKADSCCKSAFEQEFGEGASREKLRHEWDQFGVKPTASLASRIWELVQNVLEWDGGEVRPKPGDHVKIIRDWRWLSLELPADMLMAAVIPRGERPDRDELTICSPNLRKLLKDGVAQTHQHVSSGISFPTVWSLCMSRQPLTPVPKEEMESNEALGPFGASSATVLAACRIVRLLFGVLAQGHASTLDEAIEWLGQYLPERKSYEARHAVVQARAVLRSPDDAEPELWVALHSGFSALCEPLHVQPSSLQNQRVSSGLEEVMKSDPLRRLGLGNARCAPDSTLFAQWFAEELHGRHERALFERYLRVRVAFFRHITEQVGQPGFSWFHNRFSRGSSLRRGIPPAAGFESAIGQCGYGVHMVSYEGRVSPPKNVKDVFS